MHPTRPWSMRRIPPGDCKTCGQVRLAELTGSALQWGSNQGQELYSHHYNSNIRPPPSDVALLASAHCCYGNLCPKLTLLLSFSPGSLSDASVAVDSPLVGIVSGDPITADPALCHRSRCEPQGTIPFKHDLSNRTLTSSDILSLSITRVFAVSILSLSLVFCLSQFI